MNISGHSGTVNQNKLKRIKEFVYDLKITNYIKNINFWIWFFIIFGILVRSSQYLYNRSLWFDESMLAINIVNRSFLDLLKPLDYHQASPLGFLVVTKLFTILLGENEFALRLFPFIGGVISIFLFYKLSKEYLTPLGVLIAVAFFSLNEQLYRYSSEFKQYSTDVLFTLILCLLFTKLKKNGISNSNLIIFSLVGAITIWFSHPIVFVLAGIGLTTIFYFIRNSDWKCLLKVALVCVIWFISFAGYYFISLQNIKNDNQMLEYWQGSFIPLIPKSLGDIDKYIIILMGFFTYLMNMTALAILCFILGVIHIYQKRKDAFFIFILPVAITFFASGFFLYPFSGRLILFLAPSILLFTSAGLEKLKIVTAPNNKIVILTVLLLFFVPFYKAGNDLIKSKDSEDIKTTLGYIQKHIKPKDEIYLYYGAVPAFNFYSNKYKLLDYNKIEGIESRKNWKGYVNDFNQLRNKKRVWVLFSHIYKKQIDDKRFFLYYLNNLGVQKDAAHSEGAVVYLYDFSLSN